MVFGYIGKSVGDQLFDQCPHLGDMLGRARLDRRPQGPERVDVLAKLLFGQFRNLADRLVQRQPGKIPRGALIDLVVDVGDVANVGDVVLAIEMPQQPKQHIEHDDRARIADMGEVVDRRPADIHAHVFGIERHERPLLPGQRIVQTQLHGKPIPCGRASSDLV